MAPVSTLVRGNHANYSSNEQSLRGSVEGRQHHGPYVVLLPGLEVEGEEATEQAEVDAGGPTRR